MSTPSPWKFFSLEELTCWCGCKQMKMNADFMEKVVKLRIHFNETLPIISGFRCPEYDRKIGSSAKPGSGPHTLGHALDISISGEKLDRFLEKFYDLKRLNGSKFMSGLGINQKGDYKGRFVHIDDLLASEANGSPRPHIWTY